MASSSSSSPTTPDQPCFGFDVFLSFQGRDTRMNFTDHLYTALMRDGIRTFRDDNSMERGRLLTPELNKAIHGSAISLIVFSENYASSPWCLDEVKMIIEKHETSSFKHEVIPVFYKVDPSDVRTQAGSFKEAFDAYDDEVNAETNIEKKRELLEKVGAWRDSLNKAATFTGLVYKDGYESLFINNIVNVVRKHLHCNALYIDQDKLVGIEDRVAVIESWLRDSSPDKVVLLIYGIGGVGISTMAKHIFNLNYRNYDGSCYLAKINETSNQFDGLIRLQSQLISTILKRDRKEIIWNVDEGRIKVINAISNFMVLIIYDDIATFKQLEALLGSKRFYPGSKVIITTRNKELLTAFRDHVEVTVHSVSMFSTSHAFELICLYVFDQDEPIELYIVLSQLFASHCMSLLLALNLLGSSLCGKPNDVWEDTMGKMVAIPDTEIQKVLTISYATLADDKDKDLFLDISCFFDGSKEVYIVKLLAQCDLYPIVGIKKVMDICLPYVEDGRVMMHHLIKQMGRKVVCQQSTKNPGKSSRSWHPEDCFSVLQDHAGTKRVEGLILDMPKIRKAKSTSAIEMNYSRKRSFEEYLGSAMHGNDANFNNGWLGKMKNMILLQLNHEPFSKKCKNLGLLSSHGFSLKAIPGDIC